MRIRVVPVLAVALLCLGVAADCPAQQKPAGAKGAQQGKAGKKKKARKQLQSQNGLSPAEAATRLERFGPNQLEAAESVPAWRKFLGQFADPLIYLLLGAVVISLIAWVLEGREEVPFEAIVIVVIVVLNAILGYVQEARAEQAVAALQRMAAATAGVVRGGREERIPAVDVVPGTVTWAVPAGLRRVELDLAAEMRAHRRYCMDHAIVVAIGGRLATGD